MPTPDFKVGHKIVTLVIRFKNLITPHKKGDEPVNEPVNESVNESVNDVLKDILKFIKNNPGVKKPAIITHIGKSKATLTRYLKQLVERNLIEYKGSDKTGGYYLKE